MYFGDFFWVLFLLFALQPIIAARWLRAMRTSNVIAIQKSRQSRVIAVIHRQEAMRFFVLDLLALFPQPVRASQGVAFGPGSNPRPH